jgi:mono/diheme cytochrome c family protein
MKTIYFLGLISLVLIFQNCKTDKPGQEKLMNNDQQESVLNKIDSVIILDSIKANVNISAALESDSTKKVKNHELKKITITAPINSNVKEKIPINKSNQELKIKEPVAEKELEQEKTGITVSENNNDQVIVENEPIKDTNIKPVADTENLKQTIDVEQNIVQDNKEWNISAGLKAVKNPTNKKDKENLAIGKNLYSKHCKSCHGKKGYGDGPKAADQEGDLGDFSTEATQGQTDGALFYKITTGRNDMPKFEKKIPDAEDRWLIVNYIRTLAE